MTKRFTFYVGSLLLTSVLLGSCSRPVAYFQPEQRVVPAESPIADATAIEPSKPTNVAVDQVEAYVHNDTKLAQNKQLSKRVNRLKYLLSESAATKTSTTTAHKMSIVERLMVKKLNKKISKHIAPNNPKKPMVNGGLLTGGAVLVLGGLLLALLTTGAGATIGVIALIVGLLALVLGLLAS